jgi:hypothetical protein
VQWRKDFFQKKERNLWMIVSQSYMKVYCPHLSDDALSSSWIEELVFGRVRLPNEKRRPKIKAPVLVGIFAGTGLHIEARRSSVIFLSTDRHILKQ